MPTTQAMLKADLIREQIVWLETKRNEIMRRGLGVNSGSGNEYLRGQFELCSELIDRLEHELKELGV